MEVDLPMPADPCNTKLRSDVVTSSKSDSYSERTSMEVTPFGNRAPGCRDKSIMSKVNGWYLFRLFSNAPSPLE